MRNSSFNFNFIVTFFRVVPFSSSSLSIFYPTLGQLRGFYIFNPLRIENDEVPKNEVSNNGNTNIQFKEWLINNKPKKVYLNSAESKDDVFSDNKEKSGIYLWLNTTNGKYYIGSAQNLSRRFSQYYSEKYLKAVYGIIHKTLLKDKHEKFSLYILKFCEVKDLILREQYYFDILSPKYNILKIASSTLGFNHTEETLVKMSEAKTGENHPNFGKNFLRSEETKAKMSEV